MIYRIDVRTAPSGSLNARGGAAAGDPRGEAVRHQIAEFGATVGPIATRRVFLIDTDADRGQVERVARELLADPVGGRAEWGRRPAGEGDSQGPIEIPLKPGVMDPAAASTEMAIRDMGLPVREVRTGRAYLIAGRLPREHPQR